MTSAARRHTITGDAFRFAGNGLSAMIRAVRYSRDQTTLPLLDKVSRFEWKFYDATTNKWVNNWQPGRRPLMAEMNLKLDDGFETRAVFWLPPVIPNAIQSVLPPGNLPPGNNLPSGNAGLINPDGTPLNTSPTPTPGAPVPLPTAP